MVEHWYVVHTKMRQERVALDHLTRQGYECYLPEIPTERLQRGKLVVTPEPLFPRYLFIRLSTGPQAQGWGPIRSTVGVSRLVSFGQVPAQVPDALIDHLRCHAARQPAQRRYQPGEAVVVTQGPFAGLDAVYQSTDSEQRVMVLLHILSQDVSLAISPTSIRKAG